jgi:hypothetical protein
MRTAYIRVFKAASQAALGNVEAASMEVERILSFEPEATVTLSTSSDRLPYRDPNDGQHLRDNLLKVGLTE